MKQILAFIHREKLNLVIAAMEQQEVGGISVLPSQGRGKGERPMIGDPRGTGKHLAQFNSLDAVLTVVDDSKVDAVSAAIANAASTGSKGDGKIFVSTIDDVMDIGSKVKGASAL